MKTLKTTILILGIAMLFNSCAKDGAAGSTGPAGAAGANGSSGLKITSYTVTVADWTLQSGTNDVWNYNTTVTVPATDMVNVYYSYDNVTFRQLNYSGVFVNGDLTLYTFTATTPLQITYYNQPTKVAATATLYYNVAVVPPAVITQHPTTNWSDYNQVKSILEEQKASQNSK
jgi:hypothetical protein